jgi:S-methylmethionine-dependent homocysteine/selenocysteine methylase
VDLIALEMLEDTTHAPLAMRAALETGLPVWLGVSCRRVDGRLVRFSESSAEVLLADILDVLVPMGPDVVTIMHSEVDAVSEALAMVRARWTGPVGVYPESGYFTKPNWNFVDVISPEDLAREARGWIDAGARIVGGCCGTGPDHIRALRRALDG